MDAPITVRNIPSGIGKSLWGQTEGVSVTMKSLEQLQEKLRRLEAQIAEAKRRLPAHSVKPPLMMDLLALEDEFDAVVKQIERLESED